MLVATLASWLAAAAPARADFVVCNRSFDVVNLAVGRDPGGGFRTDGWWTIGTNQCARVIKGALQNRFVYLYATDVFGKPLLDGRTEMCVGAAKFSISGIGDCWQRGTIAARFHEVDTHSAESWTFFLRQPGAGAGTGASPAGSGLQDTAAPKAAKP